MVERKRNRQGVISVGELPPPGGSTLSGLVRQDPASWGRFWERYGPHVFNWLRSRWNHTDAEDVFHNSFIKLRNAPLDIGKDVVALLWTITHNEFINHLNKSNRVQVGTEEVREILLSQADRRDFCEPLYNEQDRELFEIAEAKVKAIFEAKNPIIWHAYFLVCRNNRTAKEAAVELAIPLGNVYRYRVQVIESLKPEIKRLEADEGR